MKKLQYLLLGAATSFMVGCGSDMTKVDNTTINITEVSSRGDGGETGSVGNDSNGGASNEINATAGTLTAGEWNDLNNWKFWQTLMQKEMYFNYQSQWSIFPTQRYSVKVTDAASNAVHDANVALVNKDGKTIWKAKTNSQGVAELWSQLFAESKDLNNTIQIEHAGNKHTIAQPTTFNQGVNEYQMSVAATAPDDKADVMVIIDATGSMEDEIAYMKAELKDVVNQVNTKMPNMQLQMGAVFYRDEGDEYVTRQSNLSADASQAINFMAQQTADGGGDYPEAVDAALEVALADQNWSSSAKTRIAFLMLDAPPHEDAKTFDKLQKAIATASEKGVKIIPIASSGIDKETEFLMRFMAMSTNGSYVFLTDHSGIGNEHIEPTTGEYRVEYLNDLLARIILQSASSKGKVLN